MRETSPSNTSTKFASVTQDLLSGSIVFLVAMPLCLGIAIASDADPIAGLISGIVGGMLVGLLSGSHTSVSGPAAGLTAIVAAQIIELGSYSTFLLAVVLAGIIQIVLGLIKAGALSAYFPTSVVKGLLAAIGIIIILKQLPLLLGHNKDMGVLFGHSEALAEYNKHPHPQVDYSHPLGDVFAGFFKSIGEVWLYSGGIQWGAIAVGVVTILFLVMWDRIKTLKQSLLPAPLLAVAISVGMAVLFSHFGEHWKLDETQLVDVPIAKSVDEFRAFFSFPDFSKLTTVAVYVAALTLAAVASLETLLNLDAVDALDPKQRRSPPNRELIAQGVGNVVVGMIGGIPLTSVVIRGSVNVNAGAQSKLSAIFHGLLLLACTALIPTVLKMIPLSCLAGILILTGFKLASPRLFLEMWREGRYQFMPFLFTLVAIVVTDLLVGIGIGLLLSLIFVLNSNLRRPLRRIMEKHVSGDVLHIELANQVSFLNRPALEQAIREVPESCGVLLDATNTDYIDPDILQMIRQYKRNSNLGIMPRISLRGFRDKYQLDDEIQFVDYTSRDVQAKLTPDLALRILQQGNERFCNNQRLARDLGRQVLATSTGQHPFAAVLSCIDSRAPVETILDCGLGDVFSVRVAGNVTSPKVLGSLEYATAVVGAKLILVLGHTKCGAVNAAVNLTSSAQSIEQATGCQHLESVLEEIRPSIPLPVLNGLRSAQLPMEQFIEDVGRKNVIHSVQRIVQQSRTIGCLVEQGRVAVVGAIYDVQSGRVEFLLDESVGLTETTVSIFKNHCSGDQQAITRAGMVGAAL